MIINDFKIIIKAKKVPVNINNEIIEYIQDSTIQNHHLHCKIPDEISSKLSVINKVPLKVNISKNSSVLSKSITNLSTQEFNNYTIDLSQSNTNDNFILIDDVMGTSASLCETMYKLYDFNKKVNFFFIPVKDVKR